MICKYHEFCTADRVFISREIGCFFDYAAHFCQGIHIYSRLGGGYVDRGADQLRFRQCLGNDRDQIAGAVGIALMHQRGKAADEVDTKRLRGAFKGFCKRYKTRLSCIQHSFY